MDLSPILDGLHDKNILGINPPVHDFTYFDLWSKPMGLLLLLQQLRMQGNRVYLVDCLHEAQTTPKEYGRFKTARMEIPKPEVYSGIRRRYHHFGLSEPLFIERLKNLPKPDYILLTSVMTYWYPGVAWCIPHLRRLFPSTPILLGGIYAQLCPDHANTLGADAVQSAPLKITAPYPAMDLYPNPHYGVLTTSYGCPLSCDYCASKRLWPSFKRRSAEALRHDFTFQKNLGVEDISFYDDALLIDKEQHFYPLCETLLAPSKLRFHTPNGLHVRQIDARCAILLRESGFKTIRLSLEGIDPQMQHASTQKVRLQEYADAVTHLKNAGYCENDLETYILAGIPGQSAEAVSNSIQYVHAVGAKPKLAEFSPIPQTPLFEQALQSCPELLKDPLLQNNSVYCTHFGKTIHPEALQQLKNQARKRG